MFTFSPSSTISAGVSHYSLSLTSAYYQCTLVVDYVTALSLRLTQRLIIILILQHLLLELLLPMSFLFSVNSTSVIILNSSLDGLYYISQLW